jgi:hypothetical protein
VPEEAASGPPNIERMFGKGKPQACEAREAVEDYVAIDGVEWKQRVLTRLCMECCGSCGAVEVAADAADWINRFLRGECRKV